MEELQQLLQETNNRLTQPRRRVFMALKKVEQPLPLHELSQLVAGVDRTSIYRTLELFVRLRIVEVVHVGWKKRYELAGPFKPHHHHLQCTVCQRIVNIDSPKLERVIEQIAESYGYKPTHHHIELEGVCESCRTQKQR